ncbi:MAG: hypothetical protein WCY96_07430 [Candidatus Cloacimonadaceae bacterium]
MLPRLIVVVKKLTILSSFSWLKADELAKVIAWQTFSLPKKEGVL